MTPECQDRRTILPVLSGLVGEDRVAGFRVAGKTGTASIGATGSNLTEPWFIGFAPATDPKIAIAVTIDRTDDGYGGTIAAPIAAEIMKLLLSELHG